MKKVVCDIEGCNSITEARTLKIPIDGEGHTEEVDLCPDHIWEHFQFFLYKNNAHELNKNIFRYLPQFKKHFGE